MGSVVAISHQRLGKSSSRTMCAKATWRRYVCDRWPRNTQDEVRAEFGLTEWEARSVVYEQISQATEDKIFRHKNGGPLLALDVLLVRFGMGCHELADQLDKEAEDARRAIETETERRRGFARRLAADRSFDQAPTEVAGPTARTIRHHD